MAVSFVKRAEDIKECKNLIAGMHRHFRQLGTISLTQVLTDGSLIREFRRLDALITGNPDKFEPIATVFTRVQSRFKKGFRSPLIMAKIELPEAMVGLDHIAARGRCTDGGAWRSRGGIRN